MTKLRLSVIAMAFGSAQANIKLRPAFFMSLSDRAAHDLVKSVRAVKIEFDWLEILRGAPPMTLRTHAAHFNEISLLLGFASVIVSLNVSCFVPPRR